MKTVEEEEPVFVPVTETQPWGPSLYQLSYLGSEIVSFAVYFKIYQDD
jgi:hypothetical protein